MNLRDDFRSFFVLYDNGDTFYFIVNSKCEIYCTRFKNIYENTKGTNMPGAHTLEFTGNSFNLKNAKGETIYSLEEYRKSISNILPTSEEKPSIKRLYIDEDVRSGLLAAEMITYDEEAVHIPGLLYEPIKSETPASSYTRARRQVAR